MIKDPSPLVGLAVGDSLGMPFETKKAGCPELLAWKGEYLPSEYHKLNPGQWTDDTMMAKLIAESLLLCGGFYPKDIADRYRHWLIQGAPRGMGKTTRKALENLDQGLSWVDSGVEGSEGNGPAMRIAPLGAFYREDPITCSEFARMEARVTHKSLEAEEGAAAIAVAIGLLMVGASPLDLVQKTTEFLHDSKIKESLLRLAAFRGNGSMTAIEAMRLFGTGCRITQTVPSALSAFVFTESYEQAIHSAIQAGGDTDTTAAIAGALAGAYYGYSSIPKKYLDGLEDKDHLRRLELKALNGPRTPVLWNL